jgi:FemAB-related protein (PEP-CTERM system-associated)
MTGGAQTMAPPHGAGVNASITVSDQVSESEWDDFVRQHPEGTIDHRWRWRDIVSDVFGHGTTYLAARRGTRLVGLLPLVLFRSRLFGRSVVSMPFLNYGGVLSIDSEATDALIDRARAVAQEFGASHIELRHVTKQAAELPCRQHKLQLTRSIPATSDELWSLLDRKVRNQVRKAQKDGLYSEVGGAELVDDFFAVFATNMRDLGTPVYTKRLFSETVRLFPQDARVSVVRSGRIPVAAGITLRHEGTVLVPWASSLRQYRQHCPNMLLYWTLLETCIRDEARIFDFGRSTPGSGPHQFKTQWGAQERPLQWEYVLLTRQSAPEHGPTTPAFARLIAAWKRMPVALANVLGPHIVRNIP